MKLTCVAIDDEPLALEVLKEYISRYTDLQLLHTFDDAISGGEYLRKHPVDLLFIDIQMPDITGLDLVRSLVHPPLVIFTTAHKKFAVEGFELEAVDYLLKPIDPDRFKKAVNRAIDYHQYKHTRQEKRAEHVFVYSEYKMIRIAVDEIRYIESLEDYIRIHLAAGKPVMTLMTMKAILAKLPVTLFRRIHRSYIVNTRKIVSIQQRKVMLTDGTELPVSDSYADFVNEWKKS